ncbi:MAG: transporter [Candidatus Parcubacteria bacterium]|nr:transporter [Candidatus Parcubacteria bacterium]
MEYLVDMNTDKRRWVALIILCLGVLMIVLDTTIVNVALPSLRVDLGFTQTSLAWVINAYILTFGGFLLLGGRLGDIFGNRKLFLIGLAFFTAASVACGISGSQTMLIVSRAIQGLGGAIVSAVALSLIMNLFTIPAERAKAMGVYSFVASAGGSIGVLLGGFLTDNLNWHYIFLVNLPLGILVFLLCFFMLPKDAEGSSDKHVDTWGAVTITASLLLAVYAIINGNERGWISIATIGLLAIALLLLFIFIRIESRVGSPLMPLHLFRKRAVLIANVVGILWSAGMFAWFFLSALYLQLILGYSASQVGLSFLPSNLIMAAFSLGLSAKIVMRFGIRKSLTFGLSLVTIGLLLLARAPVGGSFLMDILPSMLLLGLGAGISFNPMLLAAMSDVEPSESGIASGIVNTAFMMGGSLGLAILASVAASRTASLTRSGVEAIASLNSGYHAAFLVGTVFVALAAIIAGTFLRSDQAIQSTEAH